METQEYISISIKDGVATLYLNRPEVHNAFDPGMISSLFSALQELEKDDTLFAVVIRGKGKSFSSGADLNYMRSLMDSEKSDNLEDASRLAALFETVYNCALPVITVAHGTVSGGANGVVAAADIALAEEDAVFRFSEVRLGLIPATISPYIIQRIGEARAAELMFTARSFSAKKAEEYGLVNHVCKQEEMESVISGFLNDFALAGPLALRKTKMLIRSVSGKEIDSEMRRFTSRLIADVRTSSEAQEGMKAFFEKRNPGWIK